MVRPLALLQVMACKPWKILQRLKGLGLLFTSRPEENHLLGRVTEEGNSRYMIRYQTERAAICSQLQKFTVRISNPGD